MTHPPSLSPAALRRIAPFVAFMLLLAARAWTPEDNTLGLDPRWIYGVTVVVVGALLGWWWRDYRELARPAWPGGAEVAGSVVVGLAVFAAWIHLDASWMVIGEPAAAFVPLTDRGELDWALIAVRWCGAALLVPVMEELFWRGWLMRWLERPSFESVPPQRVGLRAIVLSTVFFVMVHNLWLAAFVAGLAYAALYVRTGKLWTAVIAHAVTNGALGVWVVATGNWQFW
jgi:CAAX prenyl protease-like protein